MKLEKYFSIVGKAVGLDVRVSKTEEIQPFGKGIGPFLEAKDILSILRNEKEISIDLKNKSIELAAC